jgi:hypothetical protein
MTNRQAPDSKHWLGLENNWGQRAISILYLKRNSDPPVSL